MELFTLGFPTAFSFDNLLFCFMGVFLGTFIGVLPGIGPLTAISLLLPITFYLDPTTALVMLAGIYYGAEYGGSTASILLNLPGQASSAITCLDGYPMAQQGRAGVALFTTTISSFVGGSVGVLILMFLAPVIVEVALSFGAAEYFAAMVFGLIAAGTISQGSPIKGISMVMVGLLLGCVGMDVNSGTYRYTFGFTKLLDGLSIVVLAIGLFGVSEVIASVKRLQTTASTHKVTLRSMIPTRDDVRRSIFPTLRGTALGSVVGPLPGVGATISTFLAYAVEKRVSREPERFGKGAIEGVASPESANNAAAMTAFIPTLSMGIPGSPTMAIMLGALMIHGITPGPQLMESHPALVWGLIASFWIGNVILLILNIPMIGLWVQMLRIPYKLLFPTIIALICVGVYSLHNSAFDVWMVLFVGAIGYILRLLDFESAPVLIGFILGPMVEEYFRRAMLLSDGDFFVVMQRPVAGTMLFATAMIVAWLVWSHLRRGRGIPPRS